MIPREHRHHGTVRPLLEDALYLQQKLWGEGYDTCIEARGHTIMVDGRPVMDVDYCVFHTPRINRP